MYLLAKFCYLVSLFLIVDPLYFILRHSDPSLEDHGLAWSPYSWFCSMVCVG